MQNSLSLERLRSLLDYDPATGVFAWKVAPNGRIAVGSQAGVISHLGYRNIKVDRKQYKAGRLAWFYVTGGWPAHEIDHINCDRDDNSFANLREATRSQNCANRKCWGKKTTPKGVSFHKRDQRWRAKIRGQWIGDFGTVDEAAAAYANAAEKIYGTFSRIA